VYQLPTRAQLRILRVIRDFQEQHQYPPTVRQILAALGLNSTGSMAWHLRRMQEQGLLGERTSNRECWQILTSLSFANTNESEDSLFAPSWAESG
jgi:SOS-response transcriptional repressor LexA